MVLTGQETFMIMGGGIINTDYEICCTIIEKLEELDSRELSRMTIMLVANIPMARELVIGQYMDVLNDDMVEE